MSDILKYKAVIGKGFSYPFYVNEDTGAVEGSEGVDNVVRSIVHILDVQIGEMPGNRGFGSSIDQLVFSINDSSNDALFQHFVIEAIENWEPRVQILSVLINRSGASEGLLELGMDFYILQTHSTGSMVYPFYIES